MDTVGENARRAADLLGSFGMMAPPMRHADEADLGAAAACQRLLSRPAIPRAKNPTGAVPLVADDAEHARHAGAGTAGSTRHYRGFNPADYKWPWPGLGAVSRGARPAPGGSLGLGGAIIGFDSTVSEDAAQAIEFAAVSQLEHRILLDFSRPAVREVAPLGWQLLHLTHGRGADHPNHLNESGGVLCRGSSGPSAAHHGVARPGYCVRMAREGSPPGSGASKRR